MSPSFLIAVILLKTIAQALDLPEADFAAGAPVEINGTVTAVLKTDSCLIEDETGRFIFQMADQSKPRLGETISARGRTDLVLNDGKRQKSLIFDSYTVTGRRELPPPALMSVSDISSGKADFLSVRTRGFISEVFSDEIDPMWNYLILRGDGEPLCVAFPLTIGSSRQRLAELIDAEVELTGVGLPHYCAERVFVGPHLELWSADCIRVVKPAPSDPFSSPELEDIYHVNPKSLTKLHRRRVEGVVLAVWGGNHLLLKDKTGRHIGVSIETSAGLPRFGESVQAVGFPETDLFHLNLTRALWRSASGKMSVGDVCPAPVSARQILLDKTGRQKLDLAFHGKLVQLTGCIRSHSFRNDSVHRLNLDSDGLQVVVDVSALDRPADDLDVGSVVRITGVVILQAENWNLSRPFPTIGTLTLVPRTPDDLLVLTRPPWWTPGRLFAVIGSLLALIVVAALWIRGLNRTIARRSRQLMREELAHRSAELRIDERTRLAVELHDSLSQNLSGLACQITSVRRALPQTADSAAERLAIAERMLTSSRNELKRCLWDLRGNTLECKDLEDAIVNTLRPVVDEAALHVRFKISRSRLTDSTLHSVLCIIRELASNAVRHGQARNIHIAGAVDGNRLLFSVRDDGTGFDLAHHKGIDSGHFGIEGVRERVGRLNGRLRLESTPGRGTLARVDVPITPL